MLCHCCAGQRSTSACHSPDDGCSRFSLSHHIGYDCQWIVTQQAELALVTWHRGRGMQAARDVWWWWTDCQDFKPGCLCGKEWVWQQAQRCHTKGLQLSEQQRVHRVGTTNSCSEDLPTWENLPEQLSHHNYPRITLPEDLLIVTSGTYEYMVNLLHRWDSKRRGVYVVAQQHSTVFILLPSKCYTQNFLCWRK